MSSAIAEKIPVRGIVYVKDLFKIQFCTTALKGCESLSALGRMWLAFYIALVRDGKEQIRAPMDAIAHAQWLAFGGHAKSKRSAQRAHKELEQAGFIKRRNPRTGANSKLSIQVAC